MSDDLHVPLPLDAQSLREADRRWEGDAASDVVRHAAPDHRPFWDAVDARRRRALLRVVGEERHER